MEKFHTTRKQSTTNNPGMETSIPFDKNDSTELFKSKRAEYAVEIRKKKNEEIINYKRFKLTSAKQDEKIFDSFVNYLSFQHIY